METNDYISIVTLLLSIAAIVITLRERSSSLRVVLYEKQLSACIAIYEKVGELDNELSVWNSFRIENDLDEEDIQEVKNRIRELLFEIEKHSLVIPDSIFLTTSRIKSILETDFKEMKQYPKLLYKEKEREEMVLNYEDLIRDHFGIEKFTREYLKVSK